VVLLVPCLSFITAAIMAVVYYRKPALIGSPMRAAD